MWNVTGILAQYAPSMLTGINIFILDGNNIYCSKKFANTIESCKFMN